jgi:hypothetical protein
VIVNVYESPIQSHIALLIVVCSFTASDVAPAVEEPEQHNTSVEMKVNHPGSTLKCNIGS